MLARMCRKRNIPPLLVGLQDSTIILKISLAVPQKIGHSKYYLRTQLYHSWAYTKKLQHITRSFPMFIAALFIISRNWKGLRCSSTEEQTQKLWYIYKMEYYSAIKNNEFMKLANG